MATRSIQVIAVLAGAVLCGAIVVAIAALSDDPGGRGLTEAARPAPVPTAGTDATPTDGDADGDTDGDAGTATGPSVLATPAFTSSTLLPPTRRAPLPRVLTASPSLDIAPVEPEPGVEVPAVGEVALTGSGWGHSVGMSQFGARAMAAQGRDHADILAHYYPGTELSEDLGRDLRVHLTWGRQRDHSVLAVAALGGPVAITIPGADDLIMEPDSDPIELRATGDRVAIVAADGAEVARTVSRIRLRWDTDGATRLRVPSLERGSNAAAGHIAWGTLEVGADSGRLHPVLTLDVEDYLRGVAEMPPSWESAALRAQAVAARTFALRHAAEGLDTDCRCHLGATPLFQAWSAFGMESQTGGDRWVAAVEATAGQVLTYEGRPAWTYYSSSHGGRSEAAEDSWAFGTPLPYLVAADDPWSVAPEAGNSRALWTVEVPNAEVAALFGLVTVHAVEVVDRTDGGSPRTLRATGTAPDGTTTTVDAGGVAAASAGGDLRLALGATLPSQQIAAIEVLEPDPDPDAPDPDPDAPDPDPDAPDPDPDDPGANDEDGTDDP